MSENQKYEGRSGTGGNSHVVEGGFLLDAYGNPVGMVFAVGGKPLVDTVENNKADANSNQLEQLRRLIESMAAADEKKPRSYGMLLNEVYEFMNGIKNPNAKKVQQLIDENVSKGAIILAMQDVEGCMRKNVEAQQKSEARRSSGGPERIPLEVLLAILAAILEGGS